MNRSEIIRLIRDEYDRLDRITNVNTKNIEIRISGRLTRKLGYFSVEKNGGNLFRSGEKLSIVISDKPEPGSDLFMDVIRHEYAHAVVYMRNPKERHVHDSVWKDVCREVGCMPKATVKSDAVPTAAASRPYKYIIRCKSCGAESKYKTESKIVKIAEKKIRGTIYCRKCRGSVFVVESLKL